MHTLCFAGTLAGASGQSVDTLLDRVGNRRLRALAAKVSPGAIELIQNNANNTRHLSQGCW